jgi:hypothetical protein
MVGTGVFSSVPEACRASIRECSAAVPHSHEATSTPAATRFHKALYPSLKPLYGLIGSLAAVEMSPSGGSGVLQSGQGSGR